MAEVKVPSTSWGRTKVPETTVMINAEGAVYWGGEHIGYVWKGHRTYSPPTHKGSRIVKYHKRVPEWQGGPRKHLTRHHADTRQTVLQRLIADCKDDR